jgi:hypothetical protein
MIRFLLLVLVTLSSPSLSLADSVTYSTLTARAKAGEAVWVRVGDSAPQYPGAVSYPLPGCSGGLWLLKPDSTVPSGLVAVEYVVVSPPRTVSENILRGYPLSPTLPPRNSKCPNGTCPRR